MPQITSNIKIQNNNYTQYAQQLESQVELDTPFPLSLLVHLLKLPSNSLMSITAIINHMYQKGQHDTKHYLQYLHSSEFWHFLEEFLQRKFGPPTALSCVQLICGCVRATKSLSAEQFEQIPILKYYDLISVWLDSSVLQYVQLALSALMVLPQRETYSDRLSTRRALVECASNPDEMVQGMAMVTMGDICYYGNDYCVHQLLEAGLMNRLRLTVLSPRARMRKYSWWILQNAVLYDTIGSTLLDEHPQIVDAAISQLSSDYEYVSRECCYFLKNLMEKTEFPSTQYNYVEALTSFFLRDMLDQNTLTLCEQAFQFLRLRTPTLLLHSSVEQKLEYLNQ